ncbi:MAG: UPF0175 family protein [Candidatus Electrothrix sp. LOE2]|nr:UPF0175 family protein [Candidatus Electrothrix sp. LOE2]
MNLTVSLPNRYFLNIDSAGMAQKLKLYTAMFMFQKGQLSAGAACEFAGVDRYTFLTACDRYNIPVVNYAPEELEQELKMLEDKLC